MDDHSPEGRLAEGDPRFEESRGEEMAEPEAVAAMLRLKEAGLGVEAGLRSFDDTLFAAKPVNASHLAELAAKLMSRSHVENAPCSAL